MDKDQILYYTKDEKELIKKTFGGDRTNLIKLRNLFWQFDDKIPEFSKDVVKLLKKIFLPELNPDIPIFQQRDFYMPLYYIKESNPEVALLHILANDEFKRYMRQQFNQLVEGKTPEQGRIILKDFTLPKGVDQEQIRFVNMLTYHIIVSRLDGTIGEIDGLANPKKEETEDEKQKRLKANSSK